MSFTPRPSERAPRYTDARTRAADADRDAGFQRFHDALGEYVGRKEMLEIAGIVVNENGWTGSRLVVGADGSEQREAVARSEATVAHLPRMSSTRPVG